MITEYEMKLVIGHLPPRFQHRVLVGSPDLHLIERFDPVKEMDWVTVGEFDLLGNEIVLYGGYYQIFDLTFEILLKELGLEEKIKVMEGVRPENLDQLLAANR